MTLQVQWFIYFFQHIAELFFQLMQEGQNNKFVYFQQT